MSGKYQQSKVQRDREKNCVNFEDGKEKKDFLFSINKSFFAKTDLRVVEVIFNVVKFSMLLICGCLSISQSR